MNAETIFMELSGGLIFVNKHCKYVILRPCPHPPKFLDH